MTRNTIGSAWVLPLFAFAATGCGSQSNEESAPSTSANGADTVRAAPTDPCALVSTDEVAAVISEKIVSAKADGDTCTYASEDAMASSVTLTVKREGAAAEMEGVKGAAKLLGNIGNELAGGEGAKGDVGNMLAGGGTPVMLGDESLFDANQQIHVRKGDVYLVVSPPMMRSRMGGGNPLLSAEQKRDMAASIAKKALGKL